MRTMTLQEHGADGSRRIRWALCSSLVSKVPMLAVAVVAMQLAPQPSYAGQNGLTEFRFLLGKNGLVPASCEWTLWLRLRNTMLQFDGRLARATGRRTQ